MVQGSVRGRVMGVDFGRARIGIAISDELRMLARPLCVIRWSGKEPPIESVTELMQRHEICEVLVGLPRNMDGSEGPSSEQSRRFAAALALSSRVSVRLIDERLSTREAYRMIQSTPKGSKPGTQSRTRTGMDAHAAAIILQRYLDGESVVPLAPAGTHEE